MLEFIRESNEDQGKDTRLKHPDEKYCKIDKAYLLTSVWREGED